MVGIKSKYCQAIIKKKCRYKYSIRTHITHIYVCTEKWYKAVVRLTSNVPTWHVTSDNYHRLCLL